MFVFLMSLNSQFRLSVEEVDDISRCKLGEVTSQAGKNIFTKKYFWVWMLCIFLYLPGIHFAPPASEQIFVFVLARIYGYVNQPLT